MQTNLTLTTLTLAASLSLTHARDARWEASSGITPDNMHPPWSSFVEVSAPPPFLTNGAPAILGNGQTNWTSDPLTRPQRFFRVQVKD